MSRLEYGLAPKPGFLQTLTDNVKNGFPALTNILSGADSVLPTYELEDESDSDSEPQFRPTHSNIPATNQHSTIQSLSSTPYSSSSPSQLSASYTTPPPSNTNNNYFPNNNYSSSSFSNTDGSVNGTNSVGNNKHTSHGQNTHTSATTTPTRKIVQVTKKGQQLSTIDDVSNESLTSYLKSAMPSSSSISSNVHESKYGDDVEKNGDDSMSDHVPFDETAAVKATADDFEARRLGNHSHSHSNKLKVYMEPDITNINLSLIDIQRVDTIIDAELLILSKPRASDLNKVPVILLNKPPHSTNPHVYHYQPGDDLPRIIHTLFSARKQLMILDDSYHQLLEKANKTPSVVEKLLAPLYGKAKTYAMYNTSVDMNLDLLELMLQTDFGLTPDNNSLIKFKMHDVNTYNRDNVSKLMVNVFINKTKHFDYYAVIQLLKQEFGAGILLFDYYKPTTTKIRLMAARMLMQAEEHRNRKDETPTNVLMKNLTNSLEALKLEKEDLLTSNKRW